MKRIIAMPLSVAVSITCFSVGIIELGKSVVDRVEYRHIEKLYTEVSSLSGEIENRVVVRSSKMLDPLGAVQVASGNKNIQVFQYETRSQADEALQYFSTLDCVDDVQLDKRIMPFGDVIYNNVDDASCFASATDNIDDMIKLVKANYSSLSEVKIAVIDSGCEDNELTHGVVQNLGNPVGADADHGTKICGTIIYNTMSNAKIYSYDVGDDDGFSNINLISALDMARADGCKIVNMSFGSYDYDPYEEEAIERCYNAGMIMIASSGNDGKHLTSSIKTYPCAFSEVMGIGALDVYRQKASFSNYGTGVDYYTVGTLVRSFQNGAEIYWSGTSAAAPVAVSIVANILAVKPNLTFNQLMSSVVTIPSHDETASYNYIDGYETLSGLVNKTLPQAEFSYSFLSSGSNMYFSFNCDSDTRVYICAPSTSRLPMNNSKYVTGGSAIPPNQYLGFGVNTSMVAVAYSDGKRKSEERVISISNLTPDKYTFDASNNEISYCQNMSDNKIKIPESIDGTAVKSIGTAAFAGNRSVETLIIPKTVENIGPYAFANCPNLKKVIVLGAPTIGRYAFENCKSLRFFYSPMTYTVNTCGLMGCESLIALDVFTLSNSNYSYVKNTAFYKSDNILNYNTSRHKFTISSISGMCFVYDCSECDEQISLRADELLDVWDEHIISRYTYFANYSSMFLFDVSGDGIINAKDYAIINNLAG